MKLDVDGFGEVEILDDRWYSVPNYVNHLGGKRNVYTIGIVKIRTIPFNEVKTYIGITSNMPNENYERDLKTIIQAGVRFYD